MKQKSIDNLQGGATVTPEQIDVALEVCERRREKGLTFLEFNDRWHAFGNLAFKDGVGYEAVLRALKAARKRIAELEHTVHTKIPTLETALVLAGEKCAEQARRIAELEARSQ